jgi:hypothetical protein
MTIYLDVIAVASAEPPPEPPQPESAEPEPPAVMPSPSGVFLIHVAPSPRLDPSTGKLEKVTIVVDDAELVDEPAHLKPFLID